MTSATWGATVAPGNWVAAAAQVHNTAISPSGGVQMIATPAPTAVIEDCRFGWSTSNTCRPDDRS